MTRLDSYYRFAVLLRDELDSLFSSLSEADCDHDRIIERIEEVRPEYDSLDRFL